MASQAVTLECCGHAEQGFVYSDATSSWTCPKCVTLYAMTMTSMGTVSIKVTRKECQSRPTKDWPFEEKVAWCEKRHGLSHLEATVYVRKKDMDFWGGWE